MKVKNHLSKTLLVEAKPMEFYCMFGKYTIHYIVIANLLFPLVKTPVNNSHDNHIFPEDANRNTV